MNGQEVKQLFNGEVMGSSNWREMTLRSGGGGS